MRKKKRLIKAVKRNLPREERVSLTAESKNSIIGYIKLLLELDRESNSTSQVSKLSNNKENQQK